MDNLFDMTETKTHKAKRSLDKSTHMHLERDGPNLGNLNLNPSLEYKGTDSLSAFCKNNYESNHFAKFETFHTHDQ